MSAAAGSENGTLRPPGDLPYRLAWRTKAMRAGAHRSAQAGTGGLFRQQTSLLEHPDPRRIDLRQSLRDPFEMLYVRRFEQSSAIGVIMLLDVSGSMSFAGQTRKMALAADLAVAFASSARRIGDSFGLLACDSVVREDLVFPSTRSRADETGMAKQIRSFIPSRRGVSGLAVAARLIGSRRQLVLLVSDFHMSEAELVATFDALSAHDVVPIALMDSGEVEALPSWGLMSLCDLETGTKRLVVMRPSLKEAWRRRAAESRARLRSAASRYGREPFEVVDKIDWDRLGAYLIGGP